MKIMVGTLNSGENDFPYCCESVKMQSIDCDHIIISNLDETESHKKLYKTFKKGNYDYLIKLDADMIFKTSTDIKTMVDKSKKGYCRVTYMVDDFFTGHAINGVHLFNKTVNWKWNLFKHNYLFPDRLDNSKKIGKSITKDRALVWHCKYASEIQAFRFGYRRVLKKGILQCRWTLENYINNKNNKILKTACLGILAATENRKYDISKLNSIYKEYKDRGIPCKYLKNTILKMK